MTAEHNQFMALAIEEARAGMRAGDRPFGSVVVRDGKVVGRGHNQVVSALDPTAHAETQAIRNAAAALKASKLDGCIMYTSCEPCPMCFGATLYAGIGTLVIGTRLTSIVRFSKGLYNIHDYNVERLNELTGGTLSIISGVLSEESDALYRDWPGWNSYPMGGGAHGKAR